MIARESRRFSPFSLDAVNFLSSDVRGAMGPYLNVFLVTQQHWSQSEVGVVTTISGLLGLAVQTPIGAAIATDFATIRSFIATAKKQGWNIIQAIAQEPKVLVNSLRIA